MADELISRDALIAIVEDSKRENPHTDGIVRRTHNHEHEHFLRLIDRLPSVNAVVLPCKVGDKLYSKDGKVAEVEAFCIDKDNVYMTVSFDCDYNCEHCAFNTWRQEHSGEYSCGGEWGEMTIPADEIGKTIFLTREEAEKAIGERKEDNAR